MHVLDDGRNPLIVVSADEVLAWLRERADAAGFADRETCAVQIMVEQPFQTGATFHHEVPRLVIMVSNIKGSRVPAPPATQKPADLGPTGLIDDR